jgi:hypothetical protein
VDPKEPPGFFILRNSIYAIKPRNVMPTGAYIMGPTAKGKTEKRIFMAGISVAPNGDYLTGAVQHWGSMVK